MKKLFSLLLALLSFVSICQAETKNTLHLKLSEKSSKEICKTTLWNKKDLSWVSSSDERSHKELGWQSKGNQEPIEIYSDQALEQIFEYTLKNLFEKCGANFVTTDSVKIPKIKLKIIQFDSGIQKGFFTGKENAKSKIVFSIETGNQTRNVNVGFEIESKRFRKNGLKQLQQSLNELFDKTIEQVFLNDQLKSI